MTDLAIGQTIRTADGKVGIVRFVGDTAFAPGDWVGVELDDDSGKNDGSVQGERYFDCDMSHGIFVRPTTITVMAQPAAQPKPAAPVRKAGARPSSMFTGSAARGAAAGDAGLGKRMSLNAPSPSPVPRASRASSIARSPTKSPTKQLATAPSSASNSRTATPSNARVSSIGTKPRPSVGGATRTSMGPPPPGARTARQSSVSSATSRTASGAAPARTPGGRLSTATGPRLGVRPGGTRNTSGDSQSGTERPSRTTSGQTTSPPKSDEDSPVRTRTAALEKLTSDSPRASPRTRPAAAAASAPQRASPAANAAATREIEDLKAKLKVLERKRLEDREKIKQLDKVQGDRDKFETIIQKLQAKFQPQRDENIELRKQLKEAEERFESVEAIQAEHDTAMELATLDREMAEETAEVLKVELEALKQKAEELELEVDILREENSEFTKGMTPADRASTGWLQMERNNERLREALLRLRDITQQQEEELRDQIKVLEEDLQEFSTMKQQFDTCKEKLTQSEAAVEDLRQQLDNALGAEDMIEDLTERNMSQAEQIEELKAVVEDLESLKEINDELEINHVQNEKELQEEIDFKEAVITEQARRAVQQEEAIDDMEYTLSRFRDLVTNLQTDLEDMRASHAVTESESEQLSSKSRAMMDLNMKLQISASKAQAKTVDLELRRLEAQEAEQHLEIVKLFLPETYQTDRDSVLALLRFRRLAFKADLLNNFIKERVHGQPHPGHEDDTFAGCDVIDKLTWVSAMCDRFVNAISHCSIEQFAKYEGALYELEPVERALNGWIDGLRKDELKEQQCASELQRSIALMSHLGEVHISVGLESFADDVHMRCLLMQSRLESAATAIHATRAMVQRVIPPAGDDDELAQYFARKSEAVITQTRSAKVIAGKTVRALEDLKSRSLSLTTDTLEAFEQSETATQELADLARKIGTDLHQLLHEEGRTEPFTYLEVQTSVQKTALNEVGNAESDLFAAYIAKLRIATSQISDLAALSADLTQTQEFERPQAPWILRSQELKALKTIPVDAEEELRHLKEEYNEARRAIALREETLATAQLKIETLEARMRDANAKVSRIADLEAFIQREKDSIASLKEDVEKQDRELKSLEADRDKWKKIAGDSRVLAAGGSEGGAGPASKAGQERAVATAREMDALQDEISGLQAAVRYLRDDNRRARVTEQRGHEWLSEPLRKPVPVAEQRRKLVAAEGKDVLAELVKLAASASVFDLGSLPADRLAWRPSRQSPQYQAAKQAEDFAAWQGWQESVVRKSQVLLGQEAVSQDAARKRAAAARSAAAAARLQIRLPDGEGKVIPGSGGEVQIVGSREWDALQGRVAVM